MEKEIIHAAKQGDAEAVAALLARDPALVNARDTDGSTPLHCAAWKGHVHVVRVLLDHGAPVNVHNENTHWGTTPLHAAAHGNQVVVAELLLAHGADPQSINLNGRTPIEETTFHKATAVARLLEAKGGTR